MHNNKCQFAANLTMMFTELPFLDRFAAAAHAGFKAVEFLSPYEYSKEVLAEQLNKHNLTMALFNSAMGDTAKGEWGLNAIPGREDDARANIHNALDYAKTLNCSRIHLMAGVVPSDEERPLYLQTLIDNIRYAADLYASHNITIVLEALCPQVKPNYLYASQWQVLEVIKLIQRPNVKVLFDVYHAQTVDGNITRLFESLFNEIGHIQIASIPERHEPDEGEIDYQYIFNLFTRYHYQGWIGCEYRPRGKTAEGLDWYKNYIKN